MAETLFNHPRYPLLVVISGPSGVGKDAALERLKQRRLRVCEQPGEHAANERRVRSWLIARRFLALSSQPVRLRYARPLP